MRLIRAMDDFEDEDGVESDGDGASAPEPPEQP
jgi:hypothetical protein